MAQQEKALSNAFNNFHDAVVAAQYSNADLFVALRSFVCTRATESVGRALVSHLADIAQEIPRGTPADLLVEAYRRTFGGPGVDQPSCPVGDKGNTSAFYRSVADAIRAGRERSSGTTEVPPSEEFH